MSPAVLRVLLDRIPSMIQPALLQGHCRHSVRNHVFPGTIPETASLPRQPKQQQSAMMDSVVSGVLLQDLTVHEMRVLDWFEGDEYERTNVSVQVPNSTPGLLTFTTGTSEEEKEEDIPFQVVPTQTYLWSNPLSDLDMSTEWSYDNFLRRHEEWYLEHTVRPCRVELDELHKSGSA